MTTFAFMFGVVIGFGGGILLASLCVVSREAKERAEREQWSEYFGEQR